MISALFRNIISLVKVQILLGGILNGNIQLSPLHRHVYTQKSALLLQLITGLQGIVQQISQKHAQIHILYGYPGRQHRLTVHPDVLFLRHRQLAVQNSIGHQIP